MKVKLIDGILYPFASKRLPVYVLISVKFSAPVQCQEVWLLIHNCYHGSISFFCIFSNRYPRPVYFSSFQSSLNLVNYAARNPVLELVFLSIHYTVCMSDVSKSQFIQIGAALWVSFELLNSSQMHNTIRDLSVGVPRNISINEKQQAIRYRRDIRSYFEYYIFPPVS